MPALAGIRPTVPVQKFPMGGDLAIHVDDGVRANPSPRIRTVAKDERLLVVVCDQLMRCFPLVTVRTVL